MEQLCGGNLGRGGPWRLTPLHSRDGGPMCFNTGGLIPLSPTQVLWDARKAVLCRRSCRRLLASLMLTAAATLVLLGAVLGIARVQGESMRPAFRERDLVLFSRAAAFRWGDVVILQEEGSTLLRKFIKRVIGVPGDAVEIDEDGRVLVNGQPFGESYAAGLTRQGRLQYPVILGEGEYFVLGDNRENSRDSRSFGSIKESQIEGKVIAVLRAGSKNERKDGNGK